MITRWFGEPWPDAELRAPVCENDALRIPIPTEVRCWRCLDAFDENSQGIVTATSGPSVENETFTLKTNDYDVTREHLVVAAHLECFLRSILGPEI